MALCSSLLMAQASALAAANVSEDVYLCIGVAIIGHFSWLNMFCCSFLCSFHMFRTFTAKTRSARSRSGSMNHFIVKFVISFAIPTVIIVRVVVGNLLASGESILDMA